jgi:CRP-like cAMP-binding protein
MATFRACSISIPFCGKDSDFLNYQHVHSVDKKSLFTTGSWFARLPEDVQDSLILAGRQRRFSAGATLFGVGDQPTGLHGLLSGEVHITGSTSTGHNILMAIHRVGDWTGFLTCLDQQPHPLSATAAVDCIIFSVPPAAVTKIFERDVATFRLLSAPELLVGRRNYHWLVEMSQRPTLQRVAERVLDLGRWTHSERTGPVSPIEHVSQESLAAATNVSRQTMNSALHELEKLGLIRVGYGRIDIVDSRGLEKLSMTEPTKSG